jgi:hypothetical protein
MSSIKRDVKKKVLPRPEAEKILEIQPTVWYAPRFTEGVDSVVFVFLGLS